MIPQRVIDDREWMEALWQQARGDVFSSDSWTETGSGRAFCDALNIRKVLASLADVHHGFMVGSGGWNCGDDLG